MHLKEALLYEKGEGICTCLLCPRRCRIKEGEKGFCKTRENRKGILYARNYGAITAIEARPIEIKPFFHFYPNSFSLTYSGYSCNLYCPWCQNWRLSIKEEGEEFIKPSFLVEEAKRLGCEGVCASFNEPSIMLEFNIDVFQKAKEETLYTCIVTNGYMEKDALDALIDAGLDGARFDIKGDEEVYKKYFHGARVDVVWRNAERAKEKGVHVEMINLIVPNVNDAYKKIKNLVKEHIRNVGKETPLHFTRYFPAHKFHFPPPPIKTLEMAYEIAKEEGVLFPYIGNVPFHPFENTFCPSCGTLLVHRTSYRVKEYRIVNGKCPRCAQYIPIKGAFIKK